MQTSIEDILILVADYLYEQELTQKWNEWTFWGM